MSQIKQNGLVITISEDTLTVDGVNYPLPKKAKGRTNLTVNNGKIIVNGYRFDIKTGEFTPDISISLILCFLLVSFVFIVGVYTSCVMLYNYWHN